jgi:hypothetical protein
MESSVAYRYLLECKQMLERLGQELQLYQREVGEMSQSLDENKHYRVVQIHRELHRMSFGFPSLFV